MPSIESLILDVPDVDAAREFYAAAFGDLGGRLQLRASADPATGFGGYSISLVVAQPADVDSYFESAVAAGATVIKSVTKSMWGYGGVVQAPDGAVWKFVSESKKNKGPATGEVEAMVLLIGVEDVRASKEFYVDRGLKVAKSFGKKYAEFAPDGGVKLALLRRAEVAKDAGVPDAEGPHRITISGVGSFTDPDGYVWEQAS